MRFVFFAWGFIAFPFVICALFILGGLVQTWRDIREEKERRRTQEKLEFIRAINRKAQGR